MDVLMVNVLLKSLRKDIWNNATLESRTYATPRLHKKKQDKVIETV